MWNKREEEAVRPAAVPVAPASSGGGAAPRELQAAIGRSITIVGDVTGDEDLTILGRVKGKIDLPKHNVTVGESGKVDADIHAKLVSVAGEVHGNLFAGEQILIRKSATMLGNLTAPRVGLEDGCCFRGSVDMETPEKGKAAVTQSPRPLATSGKLGEGAGPMGGGVAVEPGTPPVRP